MKRFAFGVLSLLLTACAAKQSKGPLAYVYRNQNRQDLLIPPGAVVPKQQMIDVRLGKARLGRKPGVACGIKTETLRLDWNKSAAVLHMDLGGSENPDRIPLSVLDDMNRFRRALVELEGNGCLRDGEAARLLTRMLEGIALPSRTAYNLRHGSVYQGYVDILPPLRMKVVAPIHDKGIAGFETVWYRIENGRLVPERTESSIKGQVTPNLAVVNAPPGTLFYRIFFLTRRTVNDHDILLLTAKTTEELEASSVKLRDDSEGACRANPSCIAVTEGWAISAEIPFTFRGRLAYVPVSGTVSDALRAAGVRQPAQAKNVRVMRPFGKTLIPVTQAGSEGDILGLVFIGGEELEWE